MKNKIIERIKDELKNIVTNDKIYNKIKKTSYYIESRNLSEKIIFTFTLLLFPIFFIGFLQIYILPLFISTLLLIFIELHYLGDLKFFLHRIFSKEFLYLQLIIQEDPHHMSSLDIIIKADPCIIEHETRYYMRDQNNGKLIRMHLPDPLEIPEIEIGRMRREAQRIHVDQIKKIILNMNLTEEQKIILNNLHKECSNLNCRRILNAYDAFYNASIIGISFDDFLKMWKGTIEVKNVNIEYWLLCCQCLHKILRELK